MLKLRPDGLELSRESLLERALAGGRRRHYGGALWIPEHAPVGRVEVLRLGVHAHHGRGRAVVEQLVAEVLDKDVVLPQLVMAMVGGKERRGVETEDGDYLRARLEDHLVCRGGEGGRAWSGVRGARYPSLPR